MKKTCCLLIAALPLLAACAPNIATRGAILDPEAVAQIKPGESTREQVASALGTPTQISTFDEKIWYYVGRETKQYSFLDPEVTKQQAIEVDFNDAGTVTGIHNLDLAQAGDIDPVGRSTPTYGHDNTFIRQLLGDLSHPLPNLGGNQSHRGDGN